MVNLYNMKNKIISILLVFIGTFGFSYILQYLTDGNNLFSTSIVIAIGASLSVGIVKILEKK